MSIWKGVLPVRRLVWKACHFACRGRQRRSRWQHTCSHNRQPSQINSLHWLLERVQVEKWIFSRVANTSKIGTLANCGKNAGSFVWTASFGAKRRKILQRRRLIQGACRPIWPEGLSGEQTSIEKARIDELLDEEAWALETESISWLICWLLTYRIFRISCIWLGSRPSWINRRGWLKNKTTRSW